ADVRAAFFRDVAAQAAAAFFQDAQARIDHAAEFARALNDAGTMTYLDVLRIQAAQGEIAADRAVAEATATLEHERLARMIGVQPAEAKVPQRLMPVPG